MLVFLFGIIRFVGAVNELSDIEYFQERARHILLDQCFCCIFGENEYGSPFGDYIFFDDYLKVPLIISIIIAVFDFFVKNTEIVVTNKKIKGCTLFDKTVNLPMDEISSVGEIAILKNVSVGTSSGRISFAFLNNSNKVYNEIIN